jgi:hypothetical protein
VKVQEDENYMDDGSKNKRWGWCWRSWWGKGDWIQEEED